MSDLLTAMARLDRTKVFLGTLAVGLLGLFLSGPIGAAILYAVVIALALVMRVTWAVAPTRMRVLRVLVLAGLAVVATAKLL